MRKRLRIALVAAMIGGSIFIGAAPASATCNPEKPSTCEAELPIRDFIENCSTSFDHGLPVTLGVCDL